MISNHVLSVVYHVHYLFLLANALTLSLKSCVLILTEMNLNYNKKQVGTTLICHTYPHAPCLSALMISCCEYFLITVNLRCFGGLQHALLKIKMFRRRFQDETSLPCDLMLFFPSSALRLRLCPTAGIQQFRRVRRKFCGAVPRGSRGRGFSDP